MYVTLYGLLNQYCLAKTLSSAYVVQEIETYFRTPTIIECEYRQKTEMLMTIFSSIIEYYEVSALWVHPWCANAHNYLGPTLGR